MLSPVCAFQTRAVLSALPVTINSESGLNEALFTWPVWPSSFLITFPRLGSHIHAPSAPATTMNRPSGLYSALEIVLEHISPIILTCTKRVASQSRTLPSSLAVTMNLPSGLKDALFTLLIWPRNSHKKHKKHKNFDRLLNQSLVLLVPFRG
jgi:hypothetical protein